MTKRQRVETVYSMGKADRIPFVPAIYEHKGALVGKSPSEICRSADYLYAGLKKEVAVYDPDMLVIGIDVYNVEAEAMGCEVVYFEDNSVPAIVDSFIERPEDITKLHIPNPEADGRMPVYLEVAEALGKELGPEMILRGAVTGPYSMASAIMGAEKFIMANIEQPGFCEELVRFCARATVDFGKAFLKRGIEPIIFDSQATPTLASPRVFRRLVTPIYRDTIIPELKAAGGRYIPFIIGGNTTPIVDDLIASGASQFLCDRPASLEKWREKALKAGVPFRANVDAVLVNTGPADAIRRQALEILKECKDHPGFLLGCGVVAYDGKAEYVDAILQAIKDVASGSVDWERELSGAAQA
ncbi:MAG TPA: uroporphyrinogen decarboxylase family protein [Bryobacteraceae bacterium]|nr:uroporphyrinogen decarboxylase family protein [Bryobacteraceae bacterium]